MSEKTRTRTQGWLVTIGAIVVALVLIGVWSEGFGLYGTETAPGTTTPPDNPT